jgi:hypothetical protein
MASALILRRRIASSVGARHRRRTPARAHVKERKDTGRRVTDPNFLVPVTRRPHVRRFLFSRVPHFTGGIKGFPRRRAARSPSKQAARSYCRAGGSLGGFASSTQAGFAACGPRQDAVCKSLPRRGPVSPTPQAPLPARIARNRPDDALGGRERKGYRIIFQKMSRENGLGSLGRQ